MGYKIIRRSDERNKSPYPEHCRHVKKIPGKNQGCIMFLIHLEGGGDFKPFFQAFQEKRLKRHRGQREVKEGNRKWKKEKGKKVEREEKRKKVQKMK